MVLARDNPFAAPRMHRLAFRALGFTWNELTERLVTSPCRWLIVGAEGHGKSTLLRQLHDWWEAQGERAGFLRMTYRQRRLSEEQMRLVSRLPEHAILFVDSLDQLDLRSWWRLRSGSRRLRGLMATSHRAGRMPTLVDCRTSVSLLAELVAELDPPPSMVADVNLEELYAKHSGNIRECLRELYDIAARLPAVNER